MRDNSSQTWRHCGVSRTQSRQTQIQGVQVRTWRNTFVERSHTPPALRHFLPNGRSLSATYRANWRTARPWRSILSRKRQHRSWGRNRIPVWFRVNNVYNQRWVRKQKICFHHRKGEEGFGEAEHRVVNHSPRGSVQAYPSRHPPIELE